MKSLAKALIIILSICNSIGIKAQPKPAFKVVPLGVYGGSDESNLSAYMLAPAGSDAYVCLDAGTLHAGIERAVANRVFAVPADTVLKRYIKGYFISHPHLDHLAGMIINSPDDAPKSIYALPYTIGVLRDNYFTWKSWANFGSEGDKPVLNKYHYEPLVPGQKTPVTNTGMTVQAFVLSHGNPYESTAFLVEHNGNYMLYLGDTGSDEVEKSTKLRELWEYVAPLIRNKSLKGIMIEVSFPDEQPLKSLFGHLTPHLLMQEMTVLGKLAGPGAMKSFPVVITHLKPAGGHISAIKKQLAVQNEQALKLIFPQQGHLLQF
ncbi:3',5'-cyclic-nucleotide phosphodiesterase [Mucilaginibacter sp. PPCGB 2223]|uniref:MBL fold metallo-hydrolase n=1 Tax=Mucilaginibacter sp. PPCGB 2223 TaxID=1886027 RepID=UPI0008267C8C|nr:3',5'-cyclic-nucleotide phosphodiesterase [Mucilaginibacter sp. PPCGB 2223]OCX53084.1 3',5'-cyclic-nucleotide phosphodiesterase [Mucilaginibacter sp. PPCGB 2223]